MVVAIHDPIPINYSDDMQCERFPTIELQKKLRTTNGGGTTEDPVALLAKQKGSKGRKSDAGHGKGTSDMSRIEVGKGDLLGTRQEGSPPP